MDLSNIIHWGGDGVDQTSQIVTWGKGIGKLDVKVTILIFCQIDFFHQFNIVLIKNIDNKNV